MEVTLRLYSPDLKGQDLKDFMREVTRTINLQTDVEAANKTDIPPKLGSTAGDPVVGQILLAALTSGSVVALFQVLKAYFENKPSLELRIESKDLPGSFQVRADHLSTDQFDKTVETIKNLLGREAHNRRQ